MVLDKLGSGLKDALQKITKRGLVDKEAVRELSEDIKKALISADVNIKLAKDVAEKIERRALKEKPAAGLTAREHTINIVYDEITNLLGKSFEEIKVERKPTVIMLVGLFGSGKCVHPDSLVPLEDGRVLTAKEVYEDLSKGLPAQYDGDAEIVDISEKRILIPSFNSKTKKIENKLLSHVWKLKGKELLDVYLDNGNHYNVKVTPEHPFFVLRHGELKKVRASELNEDDFVAIPRNYSYNGAPIDLFKDLKQLDLNLDLGVRLPTKDPLNILVKKLAYPRNYCKFTMDMKRGITPISLVEELGSSILRLRYKGDQKFVTFPRYLTQDLAEFLGYLIGDGHLNKKYIQIVSEDEEVVNRIKFLSKSLFGIEAVVKRDLGTKSLNDIRIISSTLVKIFNQAFGINISKKGTNLKVPQQIFRSELDIIRQFVKAYFDCDSSVSKRSREIEITSESKSLIKSINLLLLRFGILSSISKKVVQGKDYWRLFIRARYAETYANKIGFRIKSKKEKTEGFVNTGLLQGCGKQDMIPIGSILRDIRASLGFSIGEIQSEVTSYGMYESKGWISRESLLKMCNFISQKGEGRIFQILKAIQNAEDIYSKFSNPVVNGAIKTLIEYELVRSENGVVCLTEKALQLLEKIDINALEYLKLLSESDVCWARVKKIGACEAPEYVYDFTVKDNHSFIADGIIVHNTTTAGKLAKMFKRQGKKVAIVQTDTWRPAAYDQLKQLAEAVNVDFFGDPEERDPVKIIEASQGAFPRFDVVVVDTAGRDALNKELTDEIKKVAKAVNPDETLLVLPADIGQTAEMQASKFHESVGVTGVIVTKLDGTAKGGGALSACSVTGAKVKLIGVGEKLDALEEFKPKNFVSRLLGMGDLETLLKKAETAIDKEQAEKMGKKVIKGELSLQDLYEQMEAVSKMGSLGQLASLIPGLGGAIPKEAMKGQEDKMKIWKYMMDSMTPAEKENPEIITQSRIKRIAKGSGRNEADVRELLKQYKQMKKAMKMLTGRAGGKMKRLMKAFGGKMPGGMPSLPPGFGL